MHRDPVTVISSWCSLVSNARKRTSLDFDRKIIGRQELQSMTRMIKESMQFRKKHPELKQRFFDLHYDELINKPLESVERIYAHFKIPLKAETRKQFADFIKSDAKSRESQAKHVYSLEQTGLTREQVSEAFSEYISEFKL